jgi:tRNA (guanine37-N1)-methyltransferase
MKIALITLFPEMFQALTDYGITGRAMANRLLEVEFFNPRDFTEDRHQTVDDRPYGGGPGMVMRCEPLQKAISAAREWAVETAEVIYLSPQGVRLTHPLIAGAAQDSRPLILLCGRYEGVDERLIEQEVDQEWSIGDYVLSGGELPAMVVMDALIRQLPGSLGHEDSAEEDSFVSGLLDYPHYTRPERYGERQVPEVLLSGNHGKIKEWRREQSLQRTLQRRPELLDEEQLKELLKHSGSRLDRNEN